MKSSLFLAFIGAAVPLFAAPHRFSRRADEPEIIPDKYIIQLKPGVSPEEVFAHHNAVRDVMRRSDCDPGAVGDTFQIGDFKAYTYTNALDETTIAELTGLDEVLAIEPDTVIYLDPTTKCGGKGGGSKPGGANGGLVTRGNSTWNLGDISHKAAGATTYVYDPSAGEGMTAYVLDTGIRATHNEFSGGRVTFGVNAATGSTTPEQYPDSNGHGTHVAATIIGKTYGVAKKATAVDVKVFDGSTTSTSIVLAGVTWAVNDITTKGAAKKSVLNLSLTASASQVFDNAIVAAYNQGILSVVAAGNSDQPASDVSPARVPQAFTVGMTQKDRSRAVLTTGIFGSNYGPELDAFAPGRDIISADYGSDFGTATKTGSSMAAPHVAGLVCYLRALEGGLDSPDQVTGRILELALKDVVGNPRGSPNVLVNNGSGA